MNKRSIMLPLLLAALLLALTGGALFGVLHTPSPQNIDVGRPGDAYFLSNFYAGERGLATDFRWSSPSAQLLINGSYDGALLLEMRLHANSFAPPEQWQFQIVRDGAPVAAADMSPDWRRYRFILPPDRAPETRPGNEALLLDVPTARPGPNDPRDLGLALDQVELRPAPLQTAPGGPALRQALLLTWGLALLLVVLWVLDGALFAPVRPAARIVRVGLAGLATAGGLVLLAARNPALLTWALPLTAGRLLLATLTLGLLWAGARYGPRLVAYLPTGRRAALALLATTTLLAHLLVFAPLPVSIRGLAALLLLALPGILTALILFRAERDPLLLGWLALCGGIAFPPLLLLALQALPGPLPGWLLLLVTDLASAVLAWVWWRQPPLPLAPAPPRHPYLLLGAVLLLAALMRLPLLGGSEFQGDESRALLKANAMLFGRPDVLVVHTKGPVEVLVPGGSLALLGTTNEFTARLPFALSGMGVLLGIYLIGRSLFDTRQQRSGMWAGLLAIAVLALDGFLIAFSRIVQYQSIVMLMMAGAFWCCWRFYQGAAHPQRYLLSAAGLLAVGLLGHYDAAAVAPALAWLVLAGGRRRGWRGQAWLRGLLPPVLVGGALLASFYLPFVLNERFTRTAEYLFGRTRQEDLITSLFNNLPTYYRLVTFYNTTFQIQWLAVILAAGIAAWIVIYVRRPPAWLTPLGIGLAALWLGAWALVVLDAGRFRLDNGLNWAIFAFGLPLAGLIAAPATPAPLRALMIWFAVPFVAESFLIADPRTHYYTMHTAAGLLIGLTIVRLVEWAQARTFGWLRVPLGLAGAGLLLLAAPYAHLVFVRPFPEYHRTFPAARPDLYQASYGDWLPEGGFFGFTHRDGMKVVGELYAQGLLNGDYDSNQKDHIIGWYVRDAFLCNYEPMYYFIALNEPLHIPQGYALFGYVTINGKRALNIYSREPVAAPQVFALEDYSATFDRRQFGDFPISGMLDELAPQQELSAAWPNGVRLRGYDLVQQRVEPGLAGIITLYWQAPRPLTGEYQPVLEVVNADGSPTQSIASYCRPDPPTGWHTRHFGETAFALPANLNAGDTLTLRAGMRHQQNGAWLPLADGSLYVEFTTPHGGGAPAAGAGPR